MTRESTIAKNTILLYLRMILVTIINLVTVRIVLNTLGVIDYGVYTVVAGMVTLLSFLSGTLSSASQRFFSYELGRNRKSEIRKIYSLTLVSYILLSIVLLVIFETIGLWFLNHKIVIPVDRMDAANFIYQFSVFSFVFSLLSIPSLALMLSNERMKPYAVLSLLQAILKLGAAIVVSFFSFDKLVLFVGVEFVVSIFVTGSYFVYTYKMFPEGRFYLYWNWNKLKELLGFAWWNMFGAFTNMLKSNGANVLLNLFFGAYINASRGIAYQVRSAFSTFVNSFFMAFRPSIVKAYASGNLKETNELFFMSTKTSFFLLLFVAIPVFLEAPTILKLWLKTVPDYTVVFVRLIILDSLFDSFNYPIAAYVQATGRIKRFQLYVSGIVFLNLPLSYVFLKFGAPPESTLWVAIVLSAIGILVRLLFIKSRLSISIRLYSKQVFMKVFSTMLMSLILPLLVWYWLPEGVVRFLLLASTGVLNTLFCIYIIGLSQIERCYVKSQAFRIWKGTRL